MFARDSQRQDERFAEAAYERPFRAESFGAGSPRKVQEETQQLCADVVGLKLGRRAKLRGEDT
eukprot:scaffold7052_cov254-Pinguiococcus_pyrenoidosus.AAC.56